MSDNIDVFKNVIFSIPSMQTVIGTIIAFGVFSGVLTNLGLAYFSDVTFNIEYVIETIFLVFILPTLATGELYHRAFDDLPRKWSYCIALFNEFILFVHGMIITATNGVGIVNSWNVFWLALITIFFINLVVLIATMGYERVQRISLISLSHPLLILATFHIFIGRKQQIGYTTYVENLGVLIIVALAVLLAFLLAEYLISTNVNVSAVKLFSGLMHKQQEILDLGYLVRPDVQTILIKNETGETTISVPWIHPGPLEGFGGGRASTDIIRYLNDNGEGFYFHVPSTHKSDPANPKDIDKIIAAMERPDTSPMASRMIKSEHENLVFYGRKWGNQKIVYMEAEEFGDYEIPVFREILDLQEVVIVDLHNHMRDAEPDIQLTYGTLKAEFFREKLLEFIEELDRESLYEYHVGYAVDPADTPKFALVEEVDGQEILIFGTEGNGISEEMVEVRERYEGEFDDIILFTTDTHCSIHKMTADKHVDPEKLAAVIEKARRKVSIGSAGFTNRQAEPMKLLKDDYLGLAYSINILARLIPLTLILVYIALILWIF
jgi:putative membrane protein